MRATVEIPHRIIHATVRPFELLVDWAHKWQDEVSIEHWRPVGRYVDQIKVEGSEDAVREFLSIVMPYARSD